MYNMYNKLNMPTLSRRTDWLRYALLPRVHRPAVSARRARIDVDLLHLPAACIPRWSDGPDTRVHLPAAHHDRICMGTEHRHADGGNQSFVAADCGDNRSRR